MWVIRPRRSIRARVGPNSPGLRREGWTPSVLIDPPYERSVRICVEAMETHSWEDRGGSLEPVGSHGGGGAVQRGGCYHAPDKD